MADLTDSPFCRTVKDISKPVIFREMISAEAVVRGNERTRKMAAFHNDERPIIQQIFGGDPAVLAEAARIIEELHAPDGFDINMGCPAPKLTSNFNGASLMRRPERAMDIVRAVKRATGRPVSVKTRLGWTDPRDIMEFAPALEQAGVDLISIHGRTKEQGFSGTADWEMIGRAKSLVSVPVLGNGDVTDTGQALDRLRSSGCDGLLIGRGALGNPWIFRELEAVLRGEAASPPSWRERLVLIRRHAHRHVEHYGDERSVITFRKHLVWYFKGFPGAKRHRTRLMSVSGLAELDGLLDEIGADR